MKGLEAEVEVEMGSSGVAVGLRGGFYGYADMKAKVESLLEGTENSGPETLHAHGVGTARQGLLRGYVTVIVEEERLQRATETGFGGWQSELGIEVEAVVAECLSFAIATNRGGTSNGLLERNRQGIISHLSGKVHVETSARAEPVDGLKTGQTELARKKTGGNPGTLGGEIGIVSDAGV